jgi:ATP phosphoribosyltransferase
VTVKLALPKGRLLRKTAARLQKAGWGLDEYNSSMGFYRPRSQRFPDVLIRVFHEKDIPIQIATGNYDLGICCRDWVEELLVKYPSSDIVRVADLGYGEGSLYMAAVSPPDASSNGTPVRIASEYPNLAEAYALRRRLSRFSVFPVWGAAEAYPPENAEMVLLPAGEGNIGGAGLVPLERVLDYSAWLIANRASRETKRLDKIVTSLGAAGGEKAATPMVPSSPGLNRRRSPVKTDKNAVWLALPDGHQQQQTVNLFNRAGIRLDDYPSAAGNRRPGIAVKGVAVKVIRPQDMPLQVANGNFDLAVTGRDWLADHKSQFPGSPVSEVLDLRLRRVRLVAVVSNEVPADDIAGLSEYIAARGQTLRVASEYVNLADKYARDNHLGHYHIIPTWGATEGFLPEDADLLIENTETGRTIARHNLKIIDTLFASTACLIGNDGALADAGKKKRIDSIVNRLKTAVEGAG